MWYYIGFIDIKIKFKIYFVGNIYYVKKNYLYK